MIRKLAQFKVRPDAADAARRAVAAFVQAVAAHEPQTTFRAYRAGDGVTFVHFMTFPSPEAERAHQTAPYTRAFVDALYPLCEELPTFTDLTPVEGP
jgi:quinol monooxygenase YgiN